jgi:hypothetical protein
METVETNSFLRRATSVVAERGWQRVTTVTAYCGKRRHSIFAANPRVHEGGGLVARTPHVLRLNAIGRLSAVGVDRQ